MTQNKIGMEHDEKIALVAHDNEKRDLTEWAKYNRDLLAHHELYATGTTGEILEHELSLAITRLQSGPLGGDQQIGAKIVDGAEPGARWSTSGLRPGGRRAGFRTCRKSSTTEARGARSQDRTRETLRELRVSVVN